MRRLFLTWLLAALVPVVGVTAVRADDKEEKKESSKATIAVFRLAGSITEAPADEEQLGFRHEKPRDQHSLALPLGEGGQLLRRVPGTADQLEEGVGAGVLRVVVGRPPRLERMPAGAGLGGRPGVPSSRWLTSTRS